MKFTAPNLANKMLPIKNGKICNANKIKPCLTWCHIHAPQVKQTVETTEIIKRLMIKAGISEVAHRRSKGLRHAYGVNAVDEEEAGLAAKMWK